MGLDKCLWIPCLFWQGDLRGSRTSSLPPEWNAADGRRKDRIAGNLLMCIWCLMSKGWQLILFISDYPIVFILLYHPRWGVCVHVQVFSSAGRKQWRYWRCTTSIASAGPKIWGVQREVLYTFIFIFYLACLTFSFCPRGIIIFLLLRKSLGHLDLARLWLTGIAGVIHIISFGNLSFRNLLYLAAIKWWFLQISTEITESAGSNGKFLCVLHTNGAAADDSHPIILVAF